MIYTGTFSLENVTHEGERALIRHQTWENGKLTRDARLFLRWNEETCSYDCEENRFTFDLGGKHPRAIGYIGSKDHGPTKKARMLVAA